MKLLLVQSLCAQGFERPKLKLSELGIKKCLLIEKAPTEKMEALVIPQLFLNKVQSSGFF